MNNTYDEQLTLVKVGYDFNEIGQQISKDIEKTQIFCCVKSVMQSEFYKAAETIFKPEIVFIVHRFEYDDQQDIIYNSVRYKVIRSYLVSTEELELVVERVKSDG